MIPADPPFEVAPLLRLERARVLELLRGLDEAAWSRPTPCPAWDVHELVLHIVGTDLGTVSWLRDAHRGSSPPPDVDGEGFIAWLDALQLEWVTGARRISPRLAVELLGLLGASVAETIAARDPAVLDAHVSWASDLVVPRWLDHGRELTEYWIHRQQIREALGHATDGRADLLEPVLEILLWAVPHHMPDPRYRHVGDPEVRVVEVRCVDLDSLRSTYRSDDRSWHRVEAAAAAPDAVVAGSAEQLWRWLTNNLSTHDAVAAHGFPEMSGAADLVEALRRTRAIVGTPK